MIEKPSSEKHVLGFTMGRSMSGTIGGIIAVVLSILGLAKIFPIYMLSIATIAVGVALLFKGIAIAGEYTKLLGTMAISNQTEKLEVGGGMSVEVLGGAAGIILGILALLGIETGMLEPVAAIVFGATLVIGSGVMTRLNNLKLGISGFDLHSQRIIEDIVSSAAGIQILVGIGAAVLGILALIGFFPLILTLVAMLAVGAATLLSGSAISTKVMHLLKK